MKNLITVRKFRHVKIVLGEVTRNKLVFLIVCLTSFFAIVQPSYAINRSEVMVRAYDWVNRSVPYSLEQTEIDIEGAHRYVIDCSGFVSMAWHLIDSSGQGLSLTTFDLAKPTISYPISKSQLRKGDILLKEDYHAIIFEAWYDSQQTKYWGLQETSAEGGANRKLLEYDTENYVPRRYVNISETSDPPGQPPGQPIITSSTYPLSSRYYKQNDASFNFRASDNSDIKGYSYVLDHSPLTEPQESSNLSSDKLNFNDLTNGTWYLHVKACDTEGKWSQSSHYKFLVDSYRPRTYAPRKVRIRRRRTASLYWKVYDPYTGNKAYVKLRIQKRVKSLSRIRRRTRYLKLFRIWRSRYLRTRNRTLKRRYRAAYNKYLRAYRKTSPYVYRTVKNVNYGWTTINRLRYYRQRFVSRTVFRFLVYAKDQARNTQRNVASNYVLVK